MPSDTATEASESADRRFMGMALHLAERGRTAPNPRVGAIVISDQGLVSGRGYHQRAGGPHAEILALREAGEAARGATLYCTLEPCNHHGRTPPCTEAVLTAGVRRVVVGCRDPKSHGGGTGVERLRSAGLDVTVGVREADARALVADFAKVAVEGRPQVTLKAATTLDGRMGARSGDSKWITSERARVAAHRIRGWHDAILVGIETVLKDDPALTVRWVEGTNPLRVILDSELRTPTDAQVLADNQVVLYHAATATPERKRALISRGAALVEVEHDQSGLDLHAVLRDLVRRDVLSLLLEGGPTIHGSFLRAGLVDRLALFLAPHILGDAEGLPLCRVGHIPRIADGWSLMNPRIRTFGTDILVEGELSSCSPD